MDQNTENNNQNKEETQQQGGGATIKEFEYDKYAEVERKATHTNAVAGLTLGILSLVAVWFSAIVGLALGIVGIVFSVKGRSERGGASMATGGLVCSIIGIVLAAVSLILTLILIGSIAGGAIFI